MAGRKTPTPDGPDLFGQAAEMKLTAPDGTVIGMAEGLPWIYTGQHAIEAAKAEHPTSLKMAATLEIQAAPAEDDGEPKLPRFKMLAHNFRPTSLEGWFFPVIVDAEGFGIPSQSRPIRMNHDVDRGVGHTDRIAIEDGKLIAEGVISRDTEAARDVVNSARNGFPWQASIGASVQQVEFVEPGKKGKANGREWPGPLNVARKTTLGEISFVDLGADDRTKVKVAAQATETPASPTGASPVTALDQWLQAKGFDPAALDDTQKASLTAMHDAEQAAEAAKTKAAQTTQRTLDEVIEARRKEDARIAEITRITADAINDRPALVDEYDKMARAAIEAKSTVQEFELAVLRLRANTAPGVFVPKGDVRHTAKVIEAAVCLAGGLERPEKHFDDRTLNMAGDRFPHGIGLIDLLTIVARENGYSSPTSKDLRGLLQAAFGQANGQIRAQGFSTLSLPGILSNTANKFLKMGFDAVESTWSSISSRRSVRDFKAITSYSLTGNFTYDKVGPGGELKHATVGEMSYTNQVETYGRMFAITRTDLINDDLDALSAVPRRLGRGAALKINNVFWTEFMDNSAFFTTARGNYFEGAATNLQISSLTTGETLFMNQTDPDGDPTAITPRILLVPNALGVTAANLMNSTQIANDTTANTVTLSNNPHAGKFRVVQSSYLSNTAYTGNSTTAWYLLAEPGEMSVIEVAFLNGRDTPIVESADTDFNTLGIQFRGYHDFGVNLQEYRAGVKSKGAA